LTTLPLAPNRALIVHDQDDRLVPVAHSRSLVSQWPGASLLETTKRGHNRVLVDRGVAREVRRFLERIPHPRPIPLDRQLAGLDSIAF
jgi:pimeloyl-ACP methyl ester carboxylesterase